MQIEHLVRDEKSGALINTDDRGLRAYKERKRLMQSQQERINSLENKITSISEDMQIIKELLLKR